MIVGPAGPTRHCASIISRALAKATAVELEDSEAAVDAASAASAALSAVP